MLDHHFPGGPVVKYLPAHAGGMGLIPGLERFHIPWGNWASGPQLLSSRARTLQQEKPIYNTEALGEQGDPSGQS